MKHVLLAMLACWAQVAAAQKTAYIPAYLLDTTTVDGKQFTWSKTLQSPNFTMIWGDSVGLNPLQAIDPSLSFNPVAMLDTLEHIYQIFQSLGFARDTVGTNLAQYKIPVVMLNTFGPNGATGFAFGGDADGVIGAFWVHPIGLQDGHVAAHELTHSLQAQTVIDYRTANGLGPAWINAGIFWETHANFMRNLIYPQDVTAIGMDVYHVETWGDWKNTYENYQLLMAIMEADSIDKVNMLWQQSLSTEYPIQAYKRLMGYGQQQLNDKMYRYVRRMTGYDFSHNNVGSYFRQARANDLAGNLSSIQATFTILKQDSINAKHFRVPIELAPEEFGYNIIPIYPDPDSCSVIVRFRGHTSIHPHTGWRYGFVATQTNGVGSRYSDIYADTSREIAFALQPQETAMYLVIMGAPDTITTNNTNDTWYGYPKHFRFPYELIISGGVPEGYQSASMFRSQLKTNGTTHPNGGGWVANGATVANSVYVGPYAMVLGNANVSGNVRIADHAIIQDATLSGQAIVQDNAVVVGGDLSGNARVQGRTYVENTQMWDDARVVHRARVSNYKLHGAIEVGGDVIVYNTTGDCDNGVYYRMTNYYADNLLECDGRGPQHPDNKDTNATWSPFTTAQMNLICYCALLPACLTPTSVQPLIEKAGRVALIWPNPTAGRIVIEHHLPPTGTIQMRVYDLQGRLAHQWEGQADRPITIDCTDWNDGIYTARLLSTSGVASKARIVVQH